MKLYYEGSFSGIFALDKRFFFQVGFLIQIYNYLHVRSCIRKCGDTSNLYPNILCEEPPIPPSSPFTPPPPQPWASPHMFCRYTVIMCAFYWPRGHPLQTEGILCSNDRNMDFGNRVADE